VFAQNPAIGEVNGVPLAVEGQWTRNTPQSATLPGGSDTTARRYGAALFATADGKLGLWGGHAPLKSGSAEAKYPNGFATWDPAANTWTEVSTTGAPLGRRSFAHFADADQNAFYVFGGFRSIGAAVSTVLKLDLGGSPLPVWSTQTPAVSGGGTWNARMSPAFFWDAASRIFVIFGGRYQGESTGGNSELWTFDPDADSLIFRDNPYSGTATYDWPRQRFEGSMALLADPGRSGALDTTHGFLYGGSSLYATDLQYSSYVALSDTFELCVSKNKSAGLDVCPTQVIPAVTSPGVRRGAPLVAQTNYYSALVAGAGAWVSSTWSNSEFLKQADDVFVPAGMSWRLEGFASAVNLVLSPNEAGWSVARQPIGFEIMVYSNDPNGWAGDDGPLSRVWTSGVLTGTGAEKGVNSLLQMQEPLLMFNSTPTFHGGASGQRYWIVNVGVFDTPWCGSCTTANPTGTNAM
jgi:hypothetical protein